MEAKLITLTTDFGHKDPFVGIMKGVIHGINPDARVIDLSHGIAPQNVMEAALVLQSAAPFFPEGTIHVAVVDPGVGTERRPLLMEAEGCFFIGPDNGIFSLVLEGKQPSPIVELSNAAYHLTPTSATFHGRDIFAPIAGYLSLGIPPRDLGSPVEDFIRLAWPDAVKTDRAVQGEIVYIDAFGNLITNIREHDLRGLQANSLTVAVSNIRVRGLAHNYTNGAEMEYVALINSMGLLEISLFKRNAHLQSGIQIGDKVEVREGQAVS